MDPRLEIDTYQPQGLEGAVSKEFLPNLLVHTVITKVVLLETCHEEPIVSSIRSYGIVGWIKAA